MFYVEKYTPQRSGLRERRRAESPTQREPSIIDKWTPEEELELWEIKLFAEKSVPHTVETLSCDSSLYYCFCITIFYGVGLFCILKNSELAEFENIN